MKAIAEQQCELYEAALQALCNDVSVYTEAGDNVELDLDALGTPPGGTATVRAEAILAVYGRETPGECARCAGDPGRCSYCGGTGREHNWLEEQ